MLASVVFLGAVLCAVGFMAWLSYFILSRVFNTSLETRRESGRISRNYLLFGLFLLAGAVILGYQFSQMESPLPVPEIAPGTPQTTLPSAPEAEMNKVLYAGGIVLSGVAFLFWLGAFTLNRSFNASLRSAREANRSAFGQLAFGTVLLGATVFFVVLFFQADRVPVLPDVPVAAQSQPAPDAAAGGSVSTAIQHKTAVIDRASEAAGTASAHAETADTVNAEE